MFSSEPFFRYILDLVRGQPRNYLSFSPCSKLYFGTNYSTTLLDTKKGFCYTVSTTSDKQVVEKLPSFSTETISDRIFLEPSYTVDVNPPRFSTSCFLDVVIKKVCKTAVPFLATAIIKKVAVMSKLTPKQIQLIATDEANLVASMYYHERNYSVAATEGIWQRVCDRVIGMYLAASTPLVTSAVSKPALTAGEHDALFDDVQNTYDGLLEMMR